MPPRYAYWTIIAGGLPTAFRAAVREDLLPTFERIRDRHPDAIMKWFARGKLWDSPEAARPGHDDVRSRRPTGDGRGGEARNRPAARRARPQDRSHEEKRGRDWRPGGEHRDPRQRFVDAKKQQNAALRKERWERKNAPARPLPPPKRGEPTGPPPGPSTRGHIKSRRPLRPRHAPPKGPRR